jgi:hypothetical protein
MRSDADIDHLVKNQMAVGEIGDCSSVFVRRSTSTKMKRTRTFQKKAKARGILKGIHREKGFYAMGRLSGLWRQDKRGI